MNEYKYMISGKDIKGSVIRWLTTERADELRAAGYTVKIVTDDVNPHLQIGRKGPGLQSPRR